MRFNALCAISTGKPNCQGCGKKLLEIFIKVVSLQISYFETWVDVRKSKAID